MKVKSEPDAHLLGWDLGGFRGGRLLERRDQEREPLGVFCEVWYFSSGVNFILIVTPFHNHPLDSTYFLFCFPNCVTVWVFCNLGSLIALYFITSLISLIPWLMYNVYKLKITLKTFIFSHPCEQNGQPAITNCAEN